ncbi:ParB/RepB/Spo0J family partition protein [Hydrogenovibrio marinus]|uniref:ParB-like N-terminal domain-containing protein n=1 Tax=Hydrogenovibrio marinus TaxID=28885 RepID=A0A066ZWD1_HYDMR|nr:ParB/RepB/Spo0J family partition protein [Hydrogenovibrio marinus]KDN94646.1 hypothetical protein EI16_12155 [Hydrogenovibrio marinus]
MAKKVDIKARAAAKKAAAKQAPTTDVEQKQSHVNEIEAEDSSLESIQTPSEVVNKFERAKASGSAASVILSEGGESKHIPLANLVENPYNARHFYKEARIERMKASIEAFGQLAPLIVCPGDKAGEYIVIDGFYRYQALGKSQRASANCLIYRNINESNMYFISREMNFERNEQSVLDDAISLKNLSESKHLFTQEEFAAETKQSRENVAKLMQIATLPKKAMQIIFDSRDVDADGEEKDIGISKAYTLSQIHKKFGDDDEFISALPGILKNYQTKRQLEDYYKSLSRSSVRKTLAKKMPTVVFNHGNGKKAGEITTKGSSISMKFKAPSKEVAKDIEDKITAILNESLEK